MLVSTGVLGRHMLGLSRQRSNPWSMGFIGLIDQADSGVPRSLQEVEMGAGHVGSETIFDIQVQYTCSTCCEAILKIKMQARYHQDISQQTVS